MHSHFQFSVQTNHLFINRFSRAFYPHWTITRICSSDILIFHMIFIHSHRSYLLTLSHTQPLDASPLHTHPFSHGFHMLSSTKRIHQSHIPSSDILTFHRNLFVLIFPTCSAFKCIPSTYPLFPRISYVLIVHMHSSIAPSGKLTFLTNFIRIQPTYMFSLKYTQSSNEFPLHTYSLFTCISYVLLH